MYFGQFNNPRVDEYLHKTFFDGVRNGFFIEAGAYNGVVDSSCYFFEKEMGWKGINIEPSNYLFNQLIKNRPSSQNLNFALVDEQNNNKELTFQEMIINDAIGRNNGVGYIDQVADEATKTDGTRTRNKKGETQSVIGISLKQLVENYAIANIDLFVLDVEGGEIAVLKDLVLSPIKPKVFCIEDNHNMVQEYCNLLKPLGYKYHSTMHVNVHFVLED